MISTHCPHCSTLARARDSKQLTHTYREYRFQCLNLECGHIFVAGLEVVRTLTPSACPRDGLEIPMASPWRLKKPPEGAQPTSQ